MFYRGKIRIIIENKTFQQKNNAIVDSFDIFIFNNVKSNLEIILLLQDEVVFKVKVLSL